MDGVHADESDSHILHNCVITSWSLVVSSATQELMMFFQSYAED